MVERFQMKHEHDWICARQDDKGDWVRHSDHLAIIGRIEDDRTDERVQWMGELSALKKQVEELTAERDALEVKAVSLLWAVPGETLCGEVQSLHKRALELQSAEAEAAALRKALIEARAVVDAVTGHNQPDRPWSRQVRDRIDAALASTKETSDA